MLPGCRIVLIGGSNLAYGINSPMIEDAFRMPVVNMGLHAGLGLRYHMLSALPYIHKGDIVVLAPEYSQFDGELSYGNEALSEAICELDPMKFFILESDGRLAFLEGLPTYAAHKLLKIVQFWKWKLYQTNKETLQYNVQGDDVGHWTRHKRLAIAPAVLKMHTPANKDVRFVARVAKMMLDRGATVKMLPPCYYEHSYKIWKPFIESLARELQSEGVGYVAPPERYVYKIDQIYDSNYHLNLQGANDRTRKLIEDVKK